MPDTIQDLILVEVQLLRADFIKFVRDTGERIVCVVDERGLLSLQLNRLDGPLIRGQMFSPLLFI